MARQYFENVLTAGYAGDTLCFGTLKDMGLLTKEYRLEPWDQTGDSCTIVWTVVGDVEFTDSYGDTHTQGDVIEWPK